MRGVPRDCVSLRRVELPGWLSMKVLRGRLASRLLLKKHPQIARILSKYARLFSHAMIVVARISTPL